MSGRPGSPPALSFLGLGLLPPIADWGRMVDAGRKFFPALGHLTIFIVALALSVLGDALRERKGRTAVPLLDIRNLSVRIPTPEGDVHAVRVLSLEIERGEIHGAIGESGCGNTMTGMAILGLAPRGARIAADPTSTAICANRPKTCAEGGSA